MLQYMIVLLDDTSTSFCHYDVPQAGRRLMSLDDLRRAIRVAMIENLTVQVVYPDYDLPQEYKDVIDTIDHSDIMPVSTATPGAEVVTVDGWQWKAELWKGRVAVMRAPLEELLGHAQQVSDLLANVQRLNVVITDVERFTDADQERYSIWLAQLGEELERLYVNGKSPQLNLLTDRMMLTAMNNCGAGDTCITLAPNGRFYVCPGFYYDDPDNDVGDLQRGFDLKNRQLYKLDHAPICRRSDAWQCRRCVWLNKRTTLEVNTPGHEQCVAAHLERNASRQLLRSIRQKGTFLPDKPEINEIDYLDPFEKLQER